MVPGAGKASDADCRGLLRTYALQFTPDLGHFVNSLHALEVFCVLQQRFHQPSAVLRWIRNIALPIKLDSLPEAISSCLQVLHGG